ncbi:hypothetical protein BCR44DRAFT_1427250 [Catenaria anguillulae PL171]|uniref:Uncharacterized protein n=1 Tax=Catenaria anguillulae PL171 TaxID=765915 RepID=A0A1Y2HZG5_9FUNG|nr:hypothetical protein BCR44DRAFT_1427250 [Catenaria anguillulae PL171]
MIRLYFRGRLDELRQLHNGLEIDLRLKRLDRLFICSFFFLGTIWTLGTRVAKESMGCCAWFRDLWA